MQNIFITGMFRSGTTLLGRMLHAHRRISIASDGVFPFFKFLRKEIARGTNALLADDFEVPLHDYYFDSKLRALYQAIQEADFNKPIHLGDLDALKELIKYWSTSNDQYAPKLEPFVDNLTGKSFCEVFINILEIIGKAYADDDTCVLGPKEVWVGEFIPALSRSFPDMKFIYIVRDPRAVLSSKKNRDAKYPHLFMLRQWRKLATLGFLYATRQSDFKNRVFLLFFEELIAKPEETTKRLCGFLNIDWDENMVQPNCYMDGKGNPWKQNTAYKREGKHAFDTGTLSRWERYLSEPEIRLVEYVCAPEMKALGYNCKIVGDICADKSLIIDPPLIPDEGLAGWVKNFENNSFEHIVLELEKERIRYDLLKNEKELSIKRHGLLLDLSFLDRDMFEYLSHCELFPEMETEPI